ncbi:MAG: riboflavin synthase [Solirubrobacterales bacterium]
MFTGLIDNSGVVASVDTTGRGATVTISTQLAATLSRGDSVAVNGACLTVTRLNGETFAAEVMHETLDRTALGALTGGEAVNLELPLAIGDRLDGHIVLGHVDGVGEILAVGEAGFSRVLRVRTPGDLAKFAVEKGSIAIDGVSLTVSAVGADWLEVSLIPETLQRTTLGTLQAGDRVNIEADVLAKHVERLLHHQSR